MNSKKYKKQALLVLIIGGMLALVLAVADGKNKDSEYIERKKPGEGLWEEEYTLEAEGMLKDYPWTVMVQERRLTPEEKKEVFQKAQEELEKQILGKNEKLEAINKDLYLPNTLQGGLVKMEYAFSDYKIFYPDGSIRELPKEAEMVMISAELECQDETSIYEFAVQAVPLEPGGKERLVNQIAATLEKENKKSGEEKLMLPKEVNGIRLFWKKKTENRSLVVGVLGAVAAGCVLMSEKEKEKKRQKERQKQLQKDYPDILGKLILLMGAGMNTVIAWERIAALYHSRREAGRTPVKPAYEEMLIAVRQMQEGIGEIQAYKNFGERCAVVEYRKLSAILVQNVRKGSAQVREILEQEKIEAYEKQKARVKTAGEEAGTKLLLPMLLMLVVVLVIIMVPAGMSMNV